MNLSGSKARNEMGECFFCKKVTFPQRRVHYVQYHYFFILHFTLFGWGGFAPNAPPAYGPAGSTVQLHVQVLDANMSTI